MHLKRYRMMRLKGRAQNRVIGQTVVGQWAETFEAREPPAIDSLWESSVREVSRPDAREHGRQPALQGWNLPKRPIRVAGVVLSCI